MESKSEYYDTDRSAGQKRDKKIKLMTSVVLTFSILISMGFLAYAYAEKTKVDELTMKLVESQAALMECRGK